MDDQGTKTRDELAPEKDPRDRHGLVGQTVDNRFAIEGVIGEGGMGIVYLGHQTNVDRKVAIKVLLPERCDNETVQRFQNEAKAASRLTHPNTITIHDFGAWGDLLYIAMEFLEGQAFQDVLDHEKCIDPVRVLKISSQVLASLQEAHQVGIIHRDIKPDNVFLKTVGGQPDFVKVLDFGVAKLNEQLRGGDATLTKAGMIFGTPKYMSPEQATARHLDARSDLYSVGVMMYEALCGRAPFEATDPVSILIQHVHDDPPPFAEAAPDVVLMPELQQIVLRAMQKKPEGRFASALEMRQAVDHVLLLMQANIGTIQAQAIPGATTASLMPTMPAPSTGPTSALPPPQPTGPTSPATPPPQSGTWSDQLGVGHVAPEPSGGLGAPVTQSGPVAVRTGSNKALLTAVIIVGVLLLGAVGYLIIAQGNGTNGGGTTDTGGVASSDVGGATPDAGQVPEPDLGAVVQVDAGATVEEDAAIVAVDAGTPPEELDQGQVALVTPDAAAQGPPDAEAALEDAVALADAPPVEEPDAAAEEDAVAMVEPDVEEAPARDTVRVRFDVQPGSAHLSFRGRDYERDGNYYVFDRADGDRLRVYASADHYRDGRATADLSDADEEGVVRVRVRLDLDPCDPANGPIDPYVCN